MGQGLPDLGKGNDILWAWKRQALMRPIAAAAKLEAVLKGLWKLCHVCWGKSICELYTVEEKVAVEVERKK